MTRIRCGVCKEAEKMQRIDRGQHCSIWWCPDCGSSDVLENHHPHPHVVKRSVAA